MILCWLLKLADPLELQITFIMLFVCVCVCVCDLGTYSFGEYSNDPIN